MHSKKNTSVFIFSVVAIFVILIIGWQMSQNEKNKIPVGTTRTAGGEIKNNNQNDKIWTTSTSSGGLSIYLSEKYKVRFLCPQSWHVGGNDLSYDHFQLFNYDESVAGKDFSNESAVNKIAVGISDTNTYGTSSDYAEKVRKEKTIIIGGQQANVVDVELVGGQIIRSYFVALPSQQGKFLAMTIYGNVANFHLLDEIATSAEFNK